MLNILVILNSTRLFDFKNLFVYLTNWALEVTIITLYLSIRCARRLDLDERPILMGWHHITFEIGFFSNFLVFFFYWGIIH